MDLRDKKGEEMETIKLQKSQTWLLQEKKLRILEAQSVVQNLGNNFQEALNQVVRENGIQDLTNWVLSEDMTEIRKKEIPPVPPPPPPDSPDAPTAE